MEITRPIFVVSDLHMGNGGPRDNFAHNDHEKHFLAFLDFVESENGQLILAGDVFELWQSNVSGVLTHRLNLLDRLARMRATYLLGNHDADLYYFVTYRWLDHPFFDRMQHVWNCNIRGTRFRIIHGHEYDPYCAGLEPGFGRITAIRSGLAEDANGGPMYNKFMTVEGRTVGRLEKLHTLWQRVCGKPDRFTMINRAIKQVTERRSVSIIGHTHRAGRVGNWLYNCGTWAETTESFVKIEPDLTTKVYDWYGSYALENTTILPS